MDLFDALIEALEKCLKKELKKKNKEENKENSYGEVKYVFYKNTYFNNHPKEKAEDEKFKKAFGISKSWIDLCDGKEVTPISDEWGTCQGKNTDMLPYYILLSDCIKEKV